jgi:hypothetical protein
MSSWIKLKGTQTGEMTLGLDGVKLKNDAGNLSVKANDDNSHAGITASNVVVANDTTGFKVDIHASPLQTADFTFILPPDNGVSGQFLQTDGVGQYVWEQPVQPGSFETETFVSLAGQTGFTVSYAPTGEAQFALNGVVINADAISVTGTQVDYDPALNSGYVIEAGDVVTISYMWGTSLPSVLNSLGDVDVVTPTNGSVLTYNAVTEKWVVGAGVVDPTQLRNGGSNVAIPVASGNIIVSVSGVSDVATFAPDGLYVNANLEVGDTINAANANITGNIVAGNIEVPFDGEINTWNLRVANDAIVTGNLNVLGTVNTTDTAAYNVTGPINEFGGLAGGAPLVINDGMDRGTLLNYFDGAPYKSFMGWKNASSEFVFGSKVSNVNNVITVTDYGNIRAHAFFGNVEGGEIRGDFIGNVSGNLVNGTSNVVIGSAGGDITMAAGGVGDVLVIKPSGVEVGGELSVGTHATVAGDLTVAGVSTLGDVGNVVITGGNPGEALFTDGAGGLSWEEITLTNLSNGNSNVVVNANSTVVISANGVPAVVSVSEQAANISGNLSVTGVTRLNVIGNVKVNGGLEGQSIITDGLGNLSFAFPQVSNLVNGNSNVIVNANSTIRMSSNGVANTFTVDRSNVAIVGNLSVTSNVTSGNLSTGDITGTGNLTIGGDSVITGSVEILDTLEVVGDITADADIDVAGNVVIAGDLTVSSDAYFSAVGNVHIPGGTNGQVLQTNGSGGLSWTTINTALRIQDEGTEIAATANTINFVGAAVTSTGVGNVVTVNVTPVDITEIVYGTSNVMIDGADGVINTSVNGVANVTVAKSTGFEVAANLKVGGIATFGDADDVKITGGAAGQTLITDGTGNLVWGDAGGAIEIRNDGTSLTTAASIVNFTGAGVTAGILGGIVTVNVPGAGSSQPTIELVAPASGVNQQFDDPAIFNLVSNTQCQVFVNGVLARSTDFTIAGTTLTFTRHLDADDEITAAPVTVLTSVPQSAIASGTSAVVVSASGPVGISSNGATDVVVVDDAGIVVSGDAHITGSTVIDGDLQVDGSVVFGDVSTVSIAGGVAGQVLSTDGSGALSWVTPVSGGGGGGGAGVTVNSTLEFVAPVDGIEQVFSDATIADILDSTTCSVFVNGVLMLSSEFTVSGTDITVHRWLSTDDVVSVAAYGVNNIAVTGAGGATSQLQYNLNGSLRGIASATYDGTKLTLGSNTNVKITGGSSGQALVTDGSGNLSWATAAAIAGGADTELQFNDGGVITGIPTATYDGTVLSLGDVSEVSIGGGSAGTSLVTDGSGGLSWGAAMLPGWTNSGPVVISAVTTAPTKGLTPVDFVRYRKISPNEYAVQVMLSQTSAGTAGSGDYLFTLPGGLEFDLASPGQRINTAAHSPAIQGFALPGGVSGTVGLDVNSTNILIVPYSTTQFRVMTTFQSSSPASNQRGFISATWYNLATVTMNLNLDFSFVAA